MIKQPTILLPHLENMGKGTLSTQGILAITRCFPLLADVIKSEGQGWRDQAQSSSSRPSSADTLLVPVWFRPLCATLAEMCSVDSFIPTNERSTKEPNNAPYSHETGCISIHSTHSSYLAMCCQIWREDSVIPPAHLCGRTIPTSTAHVEAKTVVKSAVTGIHPYCLASSPYFACTELYWGTITARTHVSMISQVSHHEKPRKPRDSFHTLLYSSQTRSVQSNRRCC